MLNISHYVTSIAVFVILVNVISIIMPKGGAAKYGRLVMAAMLTAMLISPLQSLLSFIAGGGSPLAALNVSAPAADASHYEAAQRDAVLARYAEELERALAGLLDTMDLALVSCRFDIDATDEAFGRLNAAALRAQKKAAKQPLIKIEPPKVRIDLWGGAAPEADEADELRRAVAAFLGLGEADVTVDID